MSGYDLGVSLDGLRRSRRLMLEREMFGEERGGDEEGKEKSENRRDFVGEDMGELGGGKGGSLNRPRNRVNALNLFHSARRASVPALSASSSSSSSSSCQPVPRARKT